MTDTDVLAIAKGAKAAFTASQLVSKEERVTALSAIRASLEELKDDVLAANTQDLDVCFSRYLRFVDLLRPTRQHELKWLRAGWLIPS
jgi:gamma-glutamyl phosphate reductase